MSLRIQSNIAAMNANRQLGISNDAMAKSLEKLSSGYRINHASDDAAGLAVSKRMEADVASFNVASRNTSEAMSLLQVGEGAYDQIGNIVTRLKELATQGTSANSSGNTTSITNEVTALKSEIDRIANATEYNGQAILRGYGTSINTYSAGIDTAGERAAIGLTSVSPSGVDDNQLYTIAATTVSVTIYKGTSASTTSQTVTATNGPETLNFSSLGITLELGPNFVASNKALDTQTLLFSATGRNFIVGTKNDSNHYINVTIDKVSVSDLNLTAVTGTALTDLDTINTAVSTLAASRGNIGSYINRLGYAAANLATTMQNTQAAESTIRDVDMAGEMTNFTKNQILVQAGTAMLAQANMAPQSVLSLFK